MYDDGAGVQVELSTLKDLPTIKGKTKYFNSFANKMEKRVRNTIAGPEELNPEIGSEFSPNVHSWLATSSAIIFVLDNGNVQINFHDHEKIIMSSKAIMFVDRKDGRTYTSLFSDFIEFGTPSKYRSKLKYAQSKIKFLMDTF